MKIGLVFAGGIAKGAYQLGFCRALREFLPVESITAVSASSVGVWNALGLLSGRPDICEEVWTGLDTTGLRAFIRTFIKSGLMNESSRRIAAMGIPSRALYGVCCEYPLMTPRFIDIRRLPPDELPLWMAAFISIPVLFPPVEIGGVKYLDGGTVDNVPLAPLAKYGLDLLLAVHFDPSYTVDSEIANAKCTLEFVFSDDGFLKNSFDFSSSAVRRMIEDGYDASSRSMERYFSRGFEDLEYIGAMAQSQVPGCFRLTFDSLLNRFNRAAKRIVCAEGRRKTEKRTAMNKAVQNAGGSL